MSYKGGRYCCVRDCTNCEWRSKLDSTLPATSFFRIPKDEKRSKVWLTRACREDLLNIDINAVHNSYRMCSIHFEDSAFTALRKRLSCKALPTIFNYKHSPRSSPGKNYSELNREPAVMRNIIPTINKPTASNEFLICDEKLKTEQVVPAGSNVNTSQAENSDNDMVKYAGHICRLCAAICNDLLDIFGELASGMSVLEKIHLHLPIEVTPDDDLPLQVCSSCIQKLDICTEIVNTSLASQTYLRTLLGLDHPPSPETVPLKTDVPLCDINDDLQEISSYSDDVNQITLSPKLHGLKNTLYVPSKQEWDFPQKSASDTELQNCILQQTDADSIQIGSSVPHLQSNDMEVVELQNSTWKVDNIMVQYGSKHTNLSADTAVTRESKSGSPNVGELVNDGKNIIIPQFDIPIGKPVCNFSIENKPETNNEVLVDAGSYHHDSTKLPAQCSQIIEIRNEKQNNKQTTSDTIENENECQILDDLLKNFIHHSNIKSNVTGISSDSEDNANTPVEINWHELNEPEMVCWLCHNLFTNSEELIDHQLSIHSKDVLFCSKCQVLFYEKKALDEHTCINGSLNNQDNKKVLNHGTVYKRDCVISEEGDNRLELDRGIAVQPNFSAKFFDLNKTAVPILPLLSKSGTSQVAEIDALPEGLQCAICSVKCETQEELKGHCLQHSSQTDESTCRFCNKKFLNKYKTKDHERIHTNEKPFVCEFCGKCFRVKAALTTHLSRHSSKEKQYVCDFEGCEKRYITKSGYSSHRITHDISRPFLCEVCGKDFRHNSNLQIHRQTHFESNTAQTYTCSTCGKFYNNRYRLKEHVRIHTNEKPYTCETCDKQFHKATQLAQHRLIHENAMKFACKYCGKRFNRRNNMRTHVRRHERTHPFQCMACSMPFHSLKEVVAHRKTHTEAELNIKRKPTKPLTNDAFKCHECGKCLSCKATLQKHIMLHTGIKTHQCTICEKTFLTKTRLNNHLTIHSGTKQFTCKFCSEGFTSRNPMLVHERLHTGEKPFQCSHCSKSFRSKFYLKQHLLVHSEERPFSCPRCDKAFRRRGDLEVHLGRHTNERPFACPVCDQRFKRNADCKNHEQKHTVDKPLDAPILLTETNSCNSCFLCGHVCENSQDLNYHYEDTHTEEIASAPNMIVIDAESLLSFPEITVPNTDEENLSSVLSGF